MDLGEFEWKEDRFGTADGLGGMHFEKNLRGRGARARRYVNTTIWAEGRVDGHAGPLGRDYVSIDRRCDVAWIREVTVVDGGGCGTEGNGDMGTMTKRRWWLWGNS